MRNIETLDHNQAPDLLEAYADREATVFGVTATLQALGDMCPIDLNDPRVTQEAKNEFVIKIANESALEIAPEHEAMFSEATERLGLEPKFTVATNEKPLLFERSEPTTETPVIAKPVGPVIAPQERSVKVAAVPEAQVADVRDVQALQAQAAEQLYEELVVRTAEVSADTTANGMGSPELRVESAPMPVQAEMVEMYTRQASHPDTEQTMYEAEASTVEPEQNPAELMPPNTYQYEEEPVVDVFDVPVFVKAETELVQEAPERHDELAESWAAELDKEAVEIYDDVATALANFAQTTELSDAQIEAGQEPTLLTPQELAIKQVAQVVADRLTELAADERQQAAEMIKNIVGAVHGLRLLEANEDADRQLVEQVRAQLQEIVSSLSEVLGLEFDAQDIEYFFQAVLQLEFANGTSSTEQTEALDLEGVGTHEVKVATPFFGSTFADEDFASKALGMFTLLCAGLHAKSLRVAA
ncbi:hypothetical protein BH09PAT4_BH09PAT4_02490 [soil metagenome]